MNDVTEEQALDAAAQAFKMIPERWRYRHGPPPKGDPNPGELRDGLEAVRSGLAIMGPPLPDEALDWVKETGIEADWGHFLDATPDFWAITPETMRAYAAQLESSRGERYRSLGCSPSGVVRAWLRAQLGHIARRLYFAIPAHYESDPGGLREIGLQWLEKNALLLPDVSQAVCLSSVSDSVGMKVVPLWTRLYHHPNAGPHVKDALGEAFVDEVVEKVRANAPSTHDDPPWA